MHRSYSGLLPAVTLLVATGCLTPKPQGRDPVEIRARYALRNWGVSEQECTSWLKSHITGYEYCASPAFEVTVEPQPGEGPVEEVVEEIVELDALRNHGQKKYEQVCQACHQADGKGLAGQFPPLAGSGDYYGDAVNMSGIVVWGLQGEIVVQGQTYNGAMPAQGAMMSDYDIAAVTTYVRTSFGNDDGIVTPDDVKAARDR